MRRHDWLPRLSKTVWQYRDTPFAWGRHDCGLFCARAVDAILGTTYAAGLYADKRGAARLLHEAGGLHRLVARWLGTAERDGEPVTGDVCQVGPRTLGVYWIGKVIVIGPSGLGYRPRADVLRFWRVA